MGISDLWLFVKSFRISSAAIREIDSLHGFPITRDHGDDARSRRLLTPTIPLAENHRLFNPVQPVAKLVRVFRWRWLQAVMEL